MTYYVRTMCQEDLSQVFAIDREAFPTQWPPPNYRHELQNRLARYIVVCDDTRTIEPETKQENGVSWLVSRLKRLLNLNPSHGQDTATAERQYIVGFAGTWVLADEAHLTNIAVRRQYQRQGIGELLLIASINLAIQMNASIMTLEVRASNFIAQNLYRKYGFTQVGIRRGYYLDNREDGILMSTEKFTSDVFQKRLQLLRGALEKKGGLQVNSRNTLSAINP